MIDSNSKIFFFIFFGLIILAIARSYYHVEILQDFHVFSEDDYIPRASDFYIKIFQ